MVMWAAWTVLFICGGVTLKDSARAVNAEDSAQLQRRSIFTASIFDWNKIADTIIRLAREDIVQHGKSELSIPNAQTEDGVSFGFFTVPYELNVSQGRVGNLTSFRRTGDVLLTKDSVETLQGDIPITFDRLVVRYDHYSVKVLGLSISGDLEGTMDNTSLLMTIYGTESGLGCTAQLKDIRVTNLGNISLNVTGLGELNGIASRILDIFLEGRWGGIVPTIEEILLHELGLVLQEYECDELHSLFLLGAV